MLTYFENKNSYSEKKFLLFVKYYANEINIDYEKFIKKIKSFKKISSKNKELNSFLNTLANSTNIEFENEKIKNILNFSNLNKKNDNDNQHKKIKLESSDNISKCSNL